MYRLLSYYLIEEGVNLHDPDSGHRIPERETVAELLDMKHSCAACALRNAQCALQF